jgi:hypothetical protein
MDRQGKEKAQQRTCRDALNRHRLRPLVMRLRNILLGVEGGVEEGVDQGRLSESALTCFRSRSARNGGEAGERGRRRTDDHGGKVEALSDGTTVVLVREVGDCKGGKGKRGGERSVRLISFPAPVSVVLHGPCPLLHASSCPQQPSPPHPPFPTQLPAKDPGTVFSCSFR